MGIKRFALFFIVWVLTCAFFLEPALVAPLFETNTAIDLVFNGNPSDLGGIPATQSNGAAVESLDHFRVLCLLYFGLPVAIYLATQLKEI